MKTIRRVSLGVAVIVLVLGAGSAPGQALYGFGPVLGSNDFFVHTIDPATGAFTRIADAGNHASTVAALDSVGQRLFFFDGSAEGYSLFTLDLRSGATTSRLAIATAATLEYERTTNRLYEIYYIGDLVWVETIVPESGQNTELAFLGSVGAVLASAIDRAGQRLFILFKTGIVENALFQVDLRTGVFSSVPTGTIVTGGGVSVSLEFDDLGRTLYGVGLRAGDSAYSVFSIDPESGAQAPVVSLPLAVFTTALDSARRRLYFTSPSSLFTVDLASLSISSAPIERCCAMLFVGSGALQPVPALGHFGWIVLGAGLALIAVILLRRS